MSSDLKPLYDDVRTIETKDQAKKWMEHMIDKVADARFMCNVRVPGDSTATVRSQRKAERQFLVMYGTVIGMLRSLHALNFLDDVAYEMFRQRANATLVAEVVGELRV